jgi:thioesterase domain-containing protein/acyl carrier protein
MANGPSATEVDDLTPPSNETESKLVAKLRDLLGLSDIGVNDDFFTIGGDSLSALELVSWIRDEFGTDPGVGVVLEAPTVKLLAERLSSNESRRGVLSLLRPGTKGAGTVVLIAGAGDSSVAQRPLAKGLIGDYAIYGAQGHGIDDRLPAERSIPLYARRIVKELRKLDPVGPYIIGGHSFGGVVAVEVVHRLEVEDCSPEGLILLDTDAPPGTQRDRIKTFLYERGHRPDRSGFGLVGPLRVARGCLERGVRDRIDAVKARGDQREYARARKTHAYNVNLTAISFWPDRRVCVPTLLVRASRGHTASHLMDEGWEDRLLGELCVEWVEGTHSSLMYEPQVYSVGATVSGWIDKTLARSAVRKYEVPSDHGRA